MIPSKSKGTPSKTVNSPSKKIVEKEIKDTNIPSKNGNTSKFRRQGTCFFLTYKTHLDIDLWRTAMEAIAPIRMFIICHETAPDPDKGEKDAYEHTHAMIEFDRKLDITDCRKFDFNEIHPNWEPTRNKPAAIQYCIKESTAEKTNFVASFDVPDYLKQLAKKLPVAQRGEIAELCDKIAKASSAFEAIKENATSLKDVMAIKMIFDSKLIEISPKLVARYKTKTLRPWQKNLYDMVANPPTEEDDRIVHWIVDKVGNKGKSFFCSYSVIQNPERTLVITATGSVRDISDIIRNECMEKKREPEVLLLDLSRTFEDRTSIYAMIETIKNGMLTCTKYKGATFMFVPPHIIVFANWMPQLEKLSMDRWNIMELSGSPNDVVVHKIDAYKAAEDSSYDESEDD